MSALDIDQSGLAAASGVSQSAISKLLNSEHGANLSGVTAMTIIKLANALSVSPGWLLAAENDSIPRKRTDTGVQATG